MENLAYSFSYLPKSEEAFRAYLQATGQKVCCKLRRGLQVQMKRHWHTYEYICETQEAVCLGWDAYPESLYCVDDTYFFVFWIPKIEFQEQWRRSLMTVGDPLGYFVHERFDVVNGQIDLFRAAGYNTQ
jgi:hypothetical protein